MTEQPGSEGKPEEGTPSGSEWQGQFGSWTGQSGQSGQGGQGGQPGQGGGQGGQDDQPGEPQWGAPQGQPGQPQWGQPPQPDQPGPWGQPGQPGQQGQGGQPQWGQQGQPWGQPPPGQPGQPGQWGPPGQYPGYGAPTEQNAIWALVLAIGSFVVCPVIPAIVALVLASNADRNIKASGGVIQGAGMVTAAKVIAWANIILIGGGLLLLVTIGGIAASA